MASESKRIIINELDFDKIKTNLKEFLKGQEKFTDYDFEGSGLSILLDVLAYNTHYNAIYNNLTINEMFLDSAVKRSSVVSRARELGYVPNSARSARAVIQLTVTNTIPQLTNITLPRLTPFNTNVDGVTYTFYTTENIVSSTGQGGVFVFNGVEIVQGTPLSYKFQVVPGSRFIIPNPNIDISTLNVRVQESATSDVFIPFYPESSIVNTQKDSTVYYLKEIDNGLYEIEFGNGVVSAGLTNGNVVHVDYFVSDMDLVNGAKAFTYQGTSLGSDYQIVTLSPSAGGIEPESIESIKRAAPRFRAAQNRAVTTDDYKALIQANFPEVSTVSVWGGEDNDPPIYGKVFICARPNDYEKLTIAQKTNIISFLSKRNVVAITPEIVDPEYIKIALSVTVYYNPRITNKTTRDIENEVIRTVQNYNETNLKMFDGIFRFSELSRIIDFCDTSIVNNISKIYLTRKISPKYNINAEYRINIINPIYTEGRAEEYVKSSQFYIAGSDSLHYFDDDGNGKIRLIRVPSNPALPNEVINSNIGTVNYLNGTIVVRNLNITSIPTAELTLTIVPASNDVVSAYTQIVEIDMNNLFVQAIPDNTVNGDTRAGKNYVFTSSRM